MFLITALAGALVAGAASAPALAQYRNLPGGSWQSSCRNSYVRGNVLTASCRADDGSYRRSSYNVSNCPGGQLGNSNGRLFCESGRNGRNTGYRGRGRRSNYAGLPAGSWRNSCNNARMNGSILTASCSTGQGYRTTSLDVRQCRSRSVGNSNGSLFCERRY
jgi:hypothetical protein